MDKSFNDQELSDIMKEIEALEEDFTQSEEKTASPIMEELAHLDESQSIPVTTPEVTPYASSNVVSLEGARGTQASAKSAPTTMSFKVQGDITLELKFDIGGKVVSLAVTETGLAIELEGGMKFTVPVSDTAGIKKAV